MLRGRNSTGARRARFPLLSRLPLRPQLLFLLLSVPLLRPMGLLLHARLLMPRRATLSTGVCLYLFHPSLHPHLLVLLVHHSMLILLLVSSLHRPEGALARHGKMRARSFTPLSLQAANLLPRATHRPLMTTQPTYVRRRLLSHRPFHVFASTPCLPPTRRLPPSILRPPRPPVLRRWSRPCCPLRRCCLLAASLSLYGTRPGGGAETASRAPTSTRLSLPLDMTCLTLCFADATRRRTSCSTRSADPCEIRLIRVVLVRGFVRPGMATSFIRGGRLRDSAAMGPQGPLAASSSRGCAARRARAARPTLILSP